MGKISDALERQQHEKEINSKMLQPESHPAGKTVIQDDFNPKLVVCSTPGSVDAENFKVLKGRIIFTSKEKTPPKTILITSALPHEGKTFTVANLAASFAQGINEHALAVDCDFRRPNLHNLLGYSNNAGLQEYLTKGKELSGLLIRTKIDKLSLLTAGSPTSNPSELLSSSMMKELFEEFKARYNDRYIIIDTAPSHVVSEVNILAQYVDAVIFVVKTSVTPKKLVEKCIKDIGQDKVLGIVFNGHEKSDKMYNKYYKKYYR